MSKAPTAGGDVDSWCTRCKMDLRHRIVAMEGERIARVECLTCHGQHNYRRPKSEEVVRAPRAKREAKESSGASRSKPRGVRQQWEEAIAGRTPAEFTPYTIAATFAAGQLVSHKKFGDGVVSEIIDAGKVQVIFSDGPKVLVQGKV
jgi:hypothetical protein